MPGPILPRKRTRPLKNDGWKSIFLLKWSLFRGHVDFWGGGCNFPDWWQKTHRRRPWRVFGIFLERRGLKELKFIEIRSIERRQCPWLLFVAPVCRMNECYPKTCPKNAWSRENHGKQPFLQEFLQHFLSSCCCLLNKTLFFWKVKWLSSWFLGLMAWIRKDWQFMNPKPWHVLPKGETPQFVLAGLPKSFAFIRGRMNASVARAYIADLIEG